MIFGRNPCGRTRRSRDAFGKGPVQVRRRRIHQIAHSRSTTATTANSNVSMPWKSQYRLAGWKIYRL
jgi:hypothetical protein